MAPPPLLMTGDTSDADETTPLCPKVTKLKQTIGILSASAVLYGNCVGAGIFISPKGVFEKTGSAGTGLLVWFFAGFITVLCTVTYAELGTMFQESGGEFVYLMKAYGKMPAFVFSFVSSFLTKPASYCVVVLTFGEYLTAMIWNEPSVWMSKTIAASLLVLVFVLNSISVKLILRVCGFLSILKLLLIGFLLLCGFVISIRGEGHKENFQDAFAGSSTTIPDYGLAFYFAVYSFMSWNSLNYMTEELKNPKRTLPIGGAIGIVGVSLSYLLANVAYLMLFSVSHIIQTNTIAMDCGYIAFGMVGKMIMSIGLLISCVGCMIGGIMALARNIQSTAEKGLFPKWAAYVSPTFHTPVPALAITTATTMFFLLFDMAVLIPCIGTAEWFFISLTFSSLLYMRWKQPNTHRPLKLPIFIPIILFILSSTFVLLPLFDAESRKNVLVGICFLPIGLVMYGVRYLIMKCFGIKEQKEEDASEYKSLKDSESSESSSEF